MISPITIYKCSYLAYCVIIVISRILGTFGYCCVALRIEIFLTILCKKHVLWCCDFVSNVQDQEYQDSMDQWDPREGLWASQVTHCFVD